MKNTLIERLTVQFEKFLDTQKRKISKEALAYRKTVFQRFVDQGFPTQKDEAWKYVQMKDFLDEDLYVYTHQEGVQLPSDPIRAAVAQMGENVVVCVNGVYSEELSTFCGGCLEVQESDVAASLEEKEDAFSLLQKAFVTKEVTIILQSTIHEQPIHVVFVTYAHGPVLVQPRVVLDVEDENEATMIEHHIQIGEKKSLTNLSFLVNIGMSSTLKHYRIQEFEENSSHIHTLHVHEQEGSTYESVTFTMGDSIVRNMHTVVLDKEHASARLYGAYLQEGGFVDNHVHVIHGASRTESAQLYKGTLDHNARGVFNGSVYVAKNLMGITSQQSNKTMLLSSSARMDTKPEFQIYSDDVSCSHGAALGSLDEDALFFMRSRGIGEKKAKDILSNGFVNEIVLNIDSSDLRQQLLSEMGQKFLLNE